MSRCSPNYKPNQIGTCLFSGLGVESYKNVGFHTSFWCFKPYTICYYESYLNIILWNPSHWLRSNECRGSFSDIYNTYIIVYGTIPSTQLLGAVSYNSLELLRIFGKILLVGFVSDARILKELSFNFSSQFIYSQFVLFCCGTYQFDRFVTCCKRNQICYIIY